MARRLRFLSAGNATGIRRMGSGATEGDPEQSIVLRIVSDDLKSQPVHQLPLTDDEALQLIAQLSGALIRRRALRRERGGE